MFVNTFISSDAIGALVVQARNHTPDSVLNDPSLPGRLAGPFITFLPGASRASVFDAADSYSNMVRLVANGDASAVISMRRFAGHLVVAFEALPDEQYLPATVRTAYESAARLLGKTPIAVR